MTRRQLRISTQDFGFGIFVSALLLLFAAGVTSCSKVKDPDKLPDGEYPMTFTAAMEEQTTPQVAQIATRATSGNTWVGNEEVAVQIGSEVKKYTAAANGTLTVATGVTPWYWQNATEEKSVSAWYPHSAAQPTSFTVQADQSGNGYQNSDMIYAAPTPISFRSNALTFRHLPVKMVVNVKAGKGVTQNEVTNATITILNQNLTSGTIDADWSVAQATIGSNTITPNTLNNTASGYQKTVQALLVPQTIAAGARMLQISIGTGHFYYTPTAEQSLAAGEQYNYQITVNATGLSVSTQISDWTTENVTGDAEMEERLPLDQAQIGDFYCVDEFDNGYILPSNATLTPEQKAACVGVVFKAGKDADGDWKDDCDYKEKDGVTPMPTIHGYVLGLYHAFDTELVRSRSFWSTNSQNANITFTPENAYIFFNGYTLTLNIISYAQSNNWELKEYFPALYWSTVAYEIDKGKAPEKSSGWFMPSAGQCLYWCQHKDIILASLKKATSNEALKWEGGYWSSTEVNRSNAVFVHFEDDIMYSAPKDNRIYIRPVFAF